MTRMTNEKEQCGNFDLPSKLEGFVVSFVLFCKAYCLTLFDIGFRTKKFATAISSGTEVSKYTRPLTTLLFQTFITARAIRIIYVFWLFVIASLFRGCDGETVVELDTPAILTSFELPAFEEIILIGIPLFLFVLMLSLITRFFLISEPRYGDLVKQYAMYVVSFQYTTYILIAIVVLLLSFAPPFLLVGSIPAPILNLAYTILNAIIFLLFGWPIYCYWRLLSLGLPAKAFRYKRKLTLHLCFLFCSIGLVLGALVGGIGLVYPLVKSDTKSFSVQTPLLATVVLSELLSSDKVTRLAILARNNSTNDLWLLTNDIVFSADPAYRVRILGGLDSNEIHAVHFLPGEQRTFAIEIVKTPITLPWSANEVVEARKACTIQFTEIMSSAQQRKINSKLRKNEKSYFEIPGSGTRKSDSQSFRGSSCGGERDGN